MLNDKFVILSGVLTVAGAAGYAYETLKGRNQPNRVTWAMWALAPMIGFFAQLSQGVGLQSILTFSMGFGPLLVLAASFANRKAYWRLTKFDLLCGSISLVALALWVLTGKGLVAIVLSIAADLFAAIPTIKKSYQDPESESGFPFLVGAVAGIITLLTINVWTVSNSAFGVYVLLTDSLIAGLVLFPGLRFKAKHQAHITHEKP
ncbi:MAG: hypothetical protein JWN01_204 [Patescibacteria group bacterium]|nr:hypothetical protein [Patescibacteria group bacterium]